ncbi:MAG: hypothetical protein ACOC2U_02360, partial [bacterium]
KVKRFIDAYNTITGEDKQLQAFFTSKLDGLEIKIFNPETDNAEDLNQMLTTAGACTSSFSANKNSNAYKFAQDAKNAGSIHFLTTNRENGLNGVYNRIYIAVDKEGNPLFFYDNIQGNQVRARSLDQFQEAGRGAELLGSFSTAIILANRLGIDRIALGTGGIYNLGASLGFTERELFKDSDKSSQKLGYTGGKIKNTGGPYMWAMKNSDTAFRTVPTTIYTTETASMIIGQSDSVIDSIRKKPKRLKSLKPDFETYFSLLNSVYTNLGLETEKHKIDSFCHEYKIEPRKI